MLRSDDDSGRDADERRRARQREQQVRCGWVGGWVVALYAYTPTLTCPAVVVHSAQRRPLSRRSFARNAPEPSLSAAQNEVGPPRRSFQVDVGGEQSVQPSLRHPCHLALAPHDRRQAQLTRSDGR